MAIYTVSFRSPNPAPGEDPFDTVDSEELSNTKLNDESIRQFDEDKTIHIIKYEFGRRQVMPTNVEQIFIKATCDTIDDTLAPEEVLDIQTFVDEVAKGAYQRKTPDSSEYIIEAKTKLKTIFANKLLANGSLAINSRYNSFGYIYAGDDKIGTFENINIDSESEFTMDDVQSIVDLTNANGIAIELYIEKEHSFYLDISRMKDKHTVVLGNIQKRDEAIPEEVMNIKAKSEYNSEEEFLSARRSLINTNLIADNFALDDLDDVLDLD